MVCDENNFTVKSFFFAVDFKDCTVCREFKFICLNGFDDVRDIVGIAVSNLVEVRGIFYFRNTADIFKNFNILDIEFFSDNALKAFNNGIVFFVGEDNFKSAEGLTVFNFVFVSDGTCKVNDVADKFNVFKKFVIFEVFGNFGEACKMYGEFACECLIDFFGNDRCNRCKEFCHVYENVIKSFISIFLVLCHFLFPETSS